MKMVLQVFRGSLRLGGEFCARILFKGFPEREKKHEISVLACGLMEGLGLRLPPQAFSKCCTKRLEI